MLVKCEHCHERVRTTQVELHLKRCVNYRRKLKAGVLPKKEDEVVSTAIVVEKPHKPAKGKGK